MTGTQKLLNTIRLRLEMFIIESGRKRSLRIGAKIRRHDLMSREKYQAIVAAKKAHLNVVLTSEEQEAFNDRRTQIRVFQESLREHLRGEETQR